MRFRSYQNLGNGDTEISFVSPCFREKTRIIKQSMYLSQRIDIVFVHSINLWNENSELFFVFSIAAKYCTFVNRASSMLVKCISSVFLFFFCIL